MNPLRSDIRKLLRVQPREGGFAATLRVDANLRVLPDHFPGQPILPGICMVQAVLIGGAQRRGVAEMRLRHLKNMKLTQPVRPGETLTIEAEMTHTHESEWRIKAKLSAEGRGCAEISLLAIEVGVPAHSPSPGNPGEGWGEGLKKIESSGARNVLEGPHPNPLPEYRERGPRGSMRPFGAEGAGV